jgi:hypothetical protein
VHNSNEDWYQAEVAGTSNEVEVDVATERTLRKRKKKVSSFASRNQFFKAQWNNMSKSEQSVYHDLAWIAKDEYENEMKRFSKTASAGTVATRAPTADETAEAEHAALLAFKRVCRADADALVERTVQTNKEAALQQSILRMEQQRLELEYKLAKQKEKLNAARISAAGSTAVFDMASESELETAV